MIYVDPSGHAVKEHTIWGGPDWDSPILDYYSHTDGSVLEPGRDELWAWFDEHPYYKPYEDPCMRQPELYTIWGAAPDHVIAAHREWVWRESGAPLSGVDYLKAFETLIALGAGFAQTNEQFSQVAAGAQAQRASLDKEFIITDVEIPKDGDDVMATWVGPELPSPDKLPDLNSVDWNGWEQRGPNLWNEELQISLHPHPPDHLNEPPHWDYMPRDHPWFRIYEGVEMIQK
jgi:hypothetical protein